MSGDPGQGKSLIEIDVAAHVTTGFPLPGDTKANREPGDVVWIGHSSEDSPATTIVPRFEAAGGDPDRLHVLDIDADVSLAAAYKAALTVQPVCSAPVPATACTARRPA